MFDEFSRLNSNVNKSKIKYNQLQSQNPSHNDRIINTLRQADPSRLKQQSEEAYKESVQELTVYLPEWRTKIKSNYEEIQEEELRRSYFIIEQFNTYVKCIQIEETYISGMIKQIEDKIEVMEIESDMKEWIQENKRHSEPPLLPVFHPWNSSPEKLTSPKPETKSREFSKVSVTTKGRGAFVLGKDRITPKTIRTILEEEGALPIGWVRAMYDYETEEPDEIAFTTGMVIKLILQDKSGWWIGELDGKTGLFPGNYVEFCFQPN